MHYSRYSRFVWVLGLSLFCLITIIAFKTPQTVISALADPHYGDSPQKTIQHFWNLMDLRQTDLAGELLIMPEGSVEQKEFKEWETRLNKDPLLSLQKLEFVNSDTALTQEIVVRVYWTSPIAEVQYVTFSMDVKQSEKGWVIVRTKQINNIL